MFDIAAALESQFDEVHYLDFYRDIFRVVVTSDNMQRKKWLDQVHDRVMQVFPGV